MVVIVIIISSGKTCSENGVHLMMLKRSSATSNGTKKKGSF
jgi:hypothetical protein